MASSFNRVILAGNMTRDPEARALPSGQALTKFSLAVNRAYTTKEGEKREEVTYVDIESYGKQAEIIAKYCGKGSGILVEGRLKLDQWEDKKTGEKRSRLGVVLENFTFIGGKAQGGEEGGSAPRSRGGNDAPAPSGDLCLARMQRDTARAPTPPVILADDDLGELDDTRRRAFWDEVGEKHQVIATGTVPPPSGEWLTYRVSGGSYLQA